MEQCNNILTEKLKKVAYMINPIFNYFNFTQYDIITLGLFLNGVSLVYLTNKNFPMFYIFLLLGHFCNILNVLYVKQFKKPTKFGNTYDNIVNWFKILLLLQVFYQIYNKKIDNQILCLTMFILFMCNIHYSIKSCIRDKLGKKIDYPTKIWIKPICKNKLEDLISYCKFTKYFDENCSFIYITLIMIFINCK